MEFPLPEGIKTHHTKAYAAIDVTRPQLSTAGKVVLITGGGSGLGLAFAQHFAKSGCTSIALTGRRATVLADAKSSIEAQYPGTTVLTLVGDVADSDAVNAAFTTVRDQLGPIDVLVSNAGYLPHYVPIGGATSKGDSVDWWKGFETNVKGAYNVLSAFLGPGVASTKKGTTVIHLSTAAVNVLFRTQSGYGASKAAATRVFEYFAVEHPEFRVVNIAPGVVLTEMHERTIEAFDRMGIPQIPMDDGELLTTISRVCGFICFDMHWCTPCFLRFVLVWVWYRDCGYGYGYSWNSIQWSFFRRFLIFI